MPALALAADAAAAQVDTRIAIGVVTGMLPHRDRPINLA
jgi:hypothetical protein